LSSFLGRVGMHVASSAAAEFFSRSGLRCIRRSWGALA
jgi:hypothetical protein